MTAAAKRFRVSQSRIRKEVFFAWRRLQGAEPALVADMAAACFRVERPTPVLLQFRSRGAAEFSLGGVTIARFDPPGGNKSVHVELR